MSAALQEQRRTQEAISLAVMRWLDSLRTIGNIRSYQDHARTADTVQPAGDEITGQNIVRTGNIVPMKARHSTAEMKPQIMIKARCKHGHEVEMFPETCLKRNGYDLYQEGSITIEWECARCPKDDYQHEVRL